MELMRESQEIRLGLADYTADALACDVAALPEPGGMEAGQARLPAAVAATSPGEVPAFVNGEKLYVRRDLRRSGPERPVTTILTASEMISL
jgi:hypothetical protein